jgi:hypothetical protein
VRAKRQLQTQAMLDRIKDSLMRQFIRRVKDGEQSALVLADLNGKWCRACDNANALPATKEVFAREVEQLLGTVEQIERRQRIEKWVGRILSAIIIMAIAAGTYAAIEFAKPFFK